MELLTPAGFMVFLQVIAIDLMLAADNAIVIGLAAAGLPKAQRAKAIMIGIVVATVLRIGFASITVQLLEIVGLLLVGGILLLWVCWKMWRELRSGDLASMDADADMANLSGPDDASGAGAAGRGKTVFQAAWQIVAADISMSLDNVLAVAGAARDHPTVLAIGLVLSIALMGFAASYIAGLLDRFRWIAYVGLLIILYIALDMIYRGSMEVWPAVAATMP